MGPWPVSVTVGGSRPIWVGPGRCALPVLPLIDLLILMGSASLGIGFILKAIEVTTRYRPAPLGFGTLTRQGDEEEHWYGRMF